MEKIGQRPSRYLTKEDIHVTKGIWKDVPYHMSLGNIYIKTRKCYHTFVRMVKIQTLSTLNFWKDIEQQELFSIADGNVK